MPFTLPLGAAAPDFRLAGVDGRVYSLAAWSAPILVIVFTCNHCPYVVGSEARTRALASRFTARGVQFVAISSNSPRTYAEDRFAEMVRRADEHPFPWPYLYDADQSVALAYGALRTPHFYVFDGKRRLQYCGHEFKNPRHVDPDATDAVEEALLDLLAGRAVKTPLTNPVGCNVNDPGMNAEACTPLRLCFPRERQTSLGVLKGSLTGARCLGACP